MPKLFERVPKGLFGPLGDPYAELYWELLASLYQHEFEREPFAVIRQVAIEVAEQVIRASSLWVARRQELEALAREDEAGQNTANRTYFPSDGFTGTSGVMPEDDAVVIRALARRLIARLEGSGWVHFQYRAGLGEIMSFHPYAARTVMVYRGHVARQTPREVYSRHYIGAAALRRRLDEIAASLAELHSRVIELAAQLKWLDGSVQLLERARAEVRRLPDFVIRAEGLAGLRLQARRLADQKQKIDRSEISALEQARDEVSKRRHTLDAERDEVQNDIGEAGQKLQQLSTELDSAQTNLANADSSMRSFSDSLEESVREGYRQRYLREREERSPAEIHEVFERQRRGIETRVANLVQNIVKLKTRYVERRGFVTAVEGAEYEEFVVELQSWRESRLPQYREKITEAKTKALQQLAEDVVFRLRENLILVRRQIDELNRALRDVPFGTEKYQFTVEVDAEHREFYNLVMDAGRFEKESLFGAAAMVAPELKVTLGGLLDRLVEAEAKEVKTELEAKADYREYFRYDLKILHADGRYSLYDKVSGDKSGGETQTPYYIAILASMYRLYRSRSLDDRPTCGLVLLDEAFGKMDESRIAATLAFARNLGLQLVLATPKERSEMVAPAVERSLLIHKDALAGTPTILDFTKEFVRNEGSDAIGAEGAAREAAGGLRE